MKSIKSLIINYIFPTLLTVFIYVIGIPQGAISVFTWIILAINAFFITLFYLCFIAMSKQTAPISRMLWPVMATDLTMWSLAKNCCFLSAITGLSLMVASPSFVFLPLLFALASILAFLAFMDHTATTYADLITKANEKYGDEGYEDDEF